jgi:hypothetical protein
MKKLISRSNCRGLTSQSVWASLRLTNTGVPSFRSGHLENCVVVGDGELYRSAQCREIAAGRVTA